MENIWLFVLTVVFYLVISLAVEIYLFHEPNWIPPAVFAKRMALVALLALPLNIGGNVFTIAGNAVAEKSVFSIFSVYQQAGNDAFSAVNIGYQKAGRDATNFIGIGYQKAGGDSAATMGLSYQQAGRDTFFGLGSSVQTAGNSAYATSALVPYQKAKNFASIFASLAGYQKSDKSASAYAAIALYQRVGEKTRAFAAFSSLTKN